MFPTWLKITSGGRSLTYCVSDLPFDSTSTSLQAPGMVKITADTPAPRHVQQTQKSRSQDGPMDPSVSFDMEKQAVGRFKAWPSSH